MRIDSFYVVILLFSGLGFQFGNANLDLISPDLWLSPTSDFASSLIADVESCENDACTLISSAGEFSSSGYAGGIGSRRLPRYVSNLYSPLEISATVVKRSSCDQHTLLLSSDPMQLQTSFSSNVPFVRFSWNCGWKAISYASNNLFFTDREECSNLTDYNIRVGINANGMAYFYDDKCEDLQTPPLGAATTPLYLFVGKNQRRASDDDDYYNYDDYEYGSWAQFDDDVYNYEYSYGDDDFVYNEDTRYVVFTSLVLNFSSSLPPTTSPTTAYPTHTPSTSTPTSSRPSLLPTLSTMPTSSLAPTAGPTSEPTFEPTFSPTPCSHRINLSTPLLFPHGHCIDTPVPQRDDDTTRVFLPFYFPFFGEYYTEIIISTNGLLSFLLHVNNFTPRPIPTTGDVPLIVPLWHDIDISRCDDCSILYRSSQDSALLSEVDSMLAGHIEHLVPPAYSSTNAFIVTFVNVPPFSSRGNADPRDTFQCVLVTDGVDSFVLFLYESIEWIGGYGDNYVSVGLDAGDRERFHSLFSPRDNTSDPNVPHAIDIDSMSNVGLAGVFMFSVGSASVQDVSNSGNCSHDAKMFVSPVIGNFVGGEIMTIRATSAACFGETALVTCSFATVNYFSTSEDKNIVAVEAVRISATEVVCNVPYMGRQGSNTVRIDIMDQAGGDETSTVSFNTVYYTAHTETTPPLLTQVVTSDESDAPICISDDAEGLLISLSWDADRVWGADKLALRLVFVSADDAEHATEFDATLVGSSFPNTGSLSISGGDVAAVFNGGVELVGYFELVPTSLLVQGDSHIDPVAYLENYGVFLNNSNSGTTSTQHYIALRSEMSCFVFGSTSSSLSLEVHQNIEPAITAPRKSRSQFSQYNGRRLHHIPEDDDATVQIRGYTVTKEYHDKYYYHFRHLRRCPCREQQIRGELWKEDPGCRKGSSCSLHKGSAVCYRQANPSVDGSSNQCCYSANGNLNTSPTGGGTADRYHYKYFAYIGTLLHFVWDVLPYYHLKKFYLPVYLYLRPIESNCDAQFNTPGFAFGDPHIVSVDNMKYIFNGVGDFHYMIGTHMTGQGAWDMSDNNTFIVVQSRMEEVGSSGASEITAIAVGLPLAGANATSGVWETQVQISRLGSQLLVRIDGAAVTFSAQIPSIDIGELVVTMNTTTMAEVIVSIPGVMILNVILKKNGLAVQCSVHTSMQHKTRGLYGVYNGLPEDDFTAKDGSVLPSNSSSHDIHYTFGMSWAIEDESHSAFHYTTSQPFSSFQRPDFNPTMLSDSSDSLSNTDCLALLHTGNVTDLSPAEVLCSCVSECIFDYLATGDESFALATVDSVQSADTERVVSETVVITCSVNDVSNSTNYTGGYLEASGMLVGDTLTLVCGDDYVLVDGQVAYCTESGEFLPSMLGSCVSTSGATSNPSSSSSSSTSLSTLYVALICVCVVLVLSVCCIIGMRMMREKEGIRVAVATQEVSDGNYHSQAV